MSPRVEVAVEAVDVFGEDLAEAFEIHVVLEVGEFDAFGDGIGFGAADEIFIGFAFAFGDAIEGGENFFAVAGLAEVIGGDGGVFDDVVEDADDAIEFALEAEHDAEGMEDVGLTVFVFLSFVRFDGEGDGVFERGHGGIVDWDGRGVEWVSVSDWGGGTRSVGRGRGQLRRVRRSCRRRR